MGYTTDLLTGLAEHLAANGIGTWSTTATYTDAETGIVLKVVPQSPDSVIVLTDYSITDDPALSDSVTGVQIRTRTGGTDPRTTDDLADSIFNLLHGARGVALGPVSTQLISRESYLTGGRDANDRHERTDNYYIHAWRPSPHRT